MEEIINKLFKKETSKYIFVYTPPKVGSTTMVSSLRISLGKSANILHIHDETMLDVLTGIKNVKIMEIILYLRNIGKKVYVIDIYRTAIERKMSEYFEKISVYHFNTSEENLSKYSIKRITDRFNNLFEHLGKGDHYRERYNLNLEEISMDISKGYMENIKENVSYIKVRLSDGDKWSSILSEVLKEDIVIIKDYEGEKKELGNVYKRFKEEYRIPSNYYNLIKESEELKLYNSCEERNAYLKKWESKVTDGHRGYSLEEYNFYLNICLENQSIGDIDVDHYIDNGCYCILCNKKRRELFIKIKRGENVSEKIIHEEVKKENIISKGNALKEVIDKINEIKSKTQGNKKYKKGQFKMGV